MASRWSVEGARYCKGLLRFVLYVVIVGVVLYGSPVTDLVRLRGAQYMVDENRPVGAWSSVAYLGSWLLLAAVVGVTMSRVNPTSTGFPFLAAITLLSGFYLADPFLSTSPVFHYDQQIWIYLVLSLFFLTILATDSAGQREHLLDFLLFCIGLQSAFAIVYYVYDINQFVTPGFGRRTSGTFFNPNVLYPLTLMGSVLSFCRALHEGYRPLRHALGAICLLSTAASVLTFTRTAWLAFSVVGGLVVFIHRSRLSGWLRLSIVLLSIFFLVGTLFIRTKGQLVGAPEDRSFWGRWEIWRVSLRIFLDKPVLGHGFQTYLARRDEFMTPELRSFNPLNTEAKNLFLNFAVEFGALGLAVLGGMLFLFLRLTHHMSRTEHSSPTIGLFAGCREATVGLLVCSVADTPVLERYRVPSTTVWMLIMGLAAAYTIRYQSHCLSACKRVRVIALASVMCLVIALLVALVVVVRSYTLLRESRPRIEALRVRKTSDVSLQHLPSTLVRALIASEDGNFYQHRGVDWQALHRALRVNIRSLRFKQGGSTITMQTARYLFVGREKTLSRKLAEILLALEMEKRLSKERILELYLNSARFGLGAEDIGTACRVYFGKKPSELTLAESAFLAGVLPEPPKTRGELTSEKVERCKRRALTRLGYFYGAQYSAEQIERAMRERVVFVWER